MGYDNAVWVERWARTVELIPHGRGEYFIIDII